MYNAYIDSLLALRRDIDNRIDNEINETLKGRGSSEKLKESILYMIEESRCLCGDYKDSETYDLDAKAANLKEELVRAEMNIARLTIGSGNCPYAFYKFEDVSIDCNNTSCSKCHSDFEKRMEEYLRDKYKAQV